MDKKIIVAIDGYSSSGKSTMAKALARLTGYIYVDSGAMYRAVTLYGLRKGAVSAERGVDEAALTALLPEIDIQFRKDEAGNQRTLLNGEDVEHEIRDLEISNLVSPVAALHPVREYLVGLQKGYGRERGIIMDGRDIGTVVFPDAEMKVFVEATAEVRAHRRLREMLEEGNEATYEEVLHNILERDRIDTTRKESPLRKAPEAITFYNNEIPLEEQMMVLHKIFDERVAQANAKDNG
ncbi:MAG: (d)CMP kinase [Muribaculaceae bacterium]|nr:(d)CMP kinase [Muribaculaceae bacterium]